MIRVDSGPKSVSRQKNPSGLISGIPAVYPERPGIEKKVYPDRIGLGKGVDTGGPVHQGTQRSRMPGRTARQMGTGRSAH